MRGGGHEPSTGASNAQLLGKNNTSLPAVLALGTAWLVCSCSGGTQLISVRTPCGQAPHALNPRPAACSICQP